MVVSLLFAFAIHICGYIEERFNLLWSFSLFLVGAFFIINIGFYSYEVFQKNTDVTNEQMEALTDFNFKDECLNHYLQKLKIDAFEDERISLFEISHFIDIDIEIGNKQRSLIVKENFKKSLGNFKNGKYKNVKKLQSIELTSKFGSKYNLSASIF